MERNTNRKSIIIPYITIDVVILCLPTTASTFKQPLTAMTTTATEYRIGAKTVCAVAAQEELVVIVAELDSG